MQTHVDGEVWGLNVPNDEFILTTGDDNQILKWSTKERKLDTRGELSKVARVLERGGASSLTHLPDSQCARAVSTNLTKRQVAVG